MTNLQKLTDLLCEVKEIKEDIMELRFGTEIKYWDTENVKHFYIWKSDFWWELLWLKTSVEWYTDCTAELEEWEEFEIIWNPIEYHHLMMYCEEDYNLKITPLYISIAKYKDYTERFIDFNNTLPLHKQSEEVLWALVEYLSNIK